MAIQSQNPLRPQPPLTRTPSQPLISSTSNSSPPLPSSQPVFKRTDSSPMIRTPAVQSMVSPEMEQSLASHVDQVPSSKLQERSGRMPAPQGLLRAIETAGLSRTQDQSVFQARDASREQVFKALVSTPSAPARPDAPKFKEQVFGTSEDVQGLAKATFAGKLKEMDSSNFNKGGVRESAEKLATKMAVELPVDILLRIKSRGSETLRLDLAKGLGLAQTPAELEGLSANKKAFLTSLVHGIERGYQEKQGADISKAIGTQFKTAVLTARTPDEVSKAVRGIVANLPPHGDLAWNLTTRPEAQLKQDIGKGLGFKMPLSERNAAVVHSVLTGINSNLPNRMRLGGDEIVLNGERFRRKGELGQGGFGKVFEYESIHEPKRSVAVKESLNPNNREALVKELDVYRHIMGPQGKGNPNITAMQAAIKGPNDSLYVVMDMLGGGDYNRLAASQNWATEMGILSKTAQSVLLQDQVRGMNKGMSYLHEEVGVIHHDHKMENVFVDTQGNLKVGDFGGSRRMGLDNSPIHLTDEGFVNHEGQIAITDNFASPRVRLSGGESGPVSTDQTDDNFTHGLAIHKASGGQTEMYGTGNFAVGQVEAFVQNPESRIRPDDPTAFGKVVNDLTKVDPSHRATTRDVSSSALLQDLDGYDQQKLGALKQANVNLSKVAGKQLNEIFNYKLGLKDDASRMREENRTRIAENRRPAYTPEMIKEVDDLLRVTDKALSLIIKGKPLAPPNFSAQDKQIFDAVHDVATGPENKLRNHIKALAVKPEFLQAVQELKRANDDFIGDIR